MAKRSEKGKGDPSARKSATEYYKLNTRAVEDLASADEENSPAVTREELERYGGKSRSGIPNWVKVCFIKFWFAGAIELFMLSGLVGGFSGFLANAENRVLIVGIVMGMVTDLLTNNVLRFMAQPDGANDPWMMFGWKSYWTFLLNILYCLILAFLVEVLYAVTNLVVVNRFGGDPIQTEPLLFGLYWLLADLGLVGIKNCVIKLVSFRKNKNV